MKVARRTAAETSKTKGSKPAPESKREEKQTPSTRFDGKKKTTHARTLNPQHAEHTPVPQRDVHGGKADAATLTAAIDAGVLKHLDGPPKGLDLHQGVDVGPGGRFNGFGLTERNAFELNGKVYVQATVWESPGKQWFEIGAKKAPPPAKTDPSAALRDRVEASSFTLLSEPPKGIKGDGVRLGPGGRFRGHDITERLAFEAGGKLYIRATVWESPDHPWFVAKPNE